MAKVFEIAICKHSKGKMITVPKVNVIAGKGLVEDRHFKDNNDKKCQITLIEVENINFYNQTFGTSIAPADFRRNIITKGIRLNELVGKEFDIGNIKVKGHDLCRPCKSLQETLAKKNIIKEFLQKGGLRCEILTSGNIFSGDAIK
tara:strand:- start:11803 stop:12240 length:438 start_codon:yes stop_codon:yes gene_type:complete